MRRVLQIAIFAAMTATLIGCSSMDLGPWGGPAYTLDAGKLGTGDQAITPRTDSTHWNGVPLDSRSRR